MNAQSEAVAGLAAGEAAFDFEAVFRAQYPRIARIIAKVVRDPARAEELAVDVFLKLWRNPAAQGETAEGWLYRTAVRQALDELRRETRRARYESLFGLAKPATPEELRAANEERQQVRRVLASLNTREASLLILRSDDLSYQELALALDLNPASVGTLLQRAQAAFRKEYKRRYEK